MAVWSLCPLHAQIHTDHALNMGRNALYFEDYMLSIQYFNRVIEAKPYLAQPFFFRGLAKLRLGDYSGAVADCSEAITKNPFFSDSYRVRAIGYIEQERYEEAVKDYRHVLSLDPRESIALYNISLCYMRLKQYEEAEKSLNELDRYTSSDKDRIWLMKAGCALEAGDTIKALACIDRSLEYDSLQEEAYSFKASVAMKNSRWEDAEKYLTQAIRCNDRSPDLYVNRALTLYYQWKYDDALLDYDAAIRVNPDHIVAHYNRGLLRQSVGDNNRAIEDFDFILALQPDNETALINRGILRLETGNYKGAVEDFSAILKRHPNFLQGYYYRAEAYKKAGMKVEASRDEAKLMRANMDMRFGGNNWRTGGSPKPARKLEDMDLEAYNRVVENEDSVAMPDYKSEFRGRIQNRSVEVQAQPMFALTYYYTTDELRPAAPYYQALEQLNMRHVLPERLYLNNRNLSLDSRRIEQRFASIDTLDRRIEVEQAKLLSSAYPDSVSENRSRVLSLFYLARSVNSSLTQDLSSALSDATEALRLDSASVWALFHRADVLFKQYRMQTDRASQPLSPSRESSVAEPVTLINPADILKDLERVCRLAPDFAFAHYNRAYVLALMQRTKEAVAGYTEAIRLDPSMGDAYVNRALLLFQLGNAADRRAAFADLSRAGELGIPQAYSLIKHYSK